MKGLFEIARILIATLVLLLIPAAGFAQSSTDRDSPDHAPAATTSADSTSDPTTMLGQHEFGRFWISGQVNVILQWHSSFPVKYSGPNSLRSQGENATSRVLTLYTGMRLTDHLEALVDVESAGGHGISEAFGLAGLTNLDVVRNPTLGSAPYIARAMLHAVIPLSKEIEESEPGPFSLFKKLPRHRLEIRFGKLGMADFFDVNSAGGDSHLQFLNWTTDNNGAFDYAADTRGYTYALMLEYQDKSWGLRFAEAMMPKVANGIHLDANLARARAENLELELRRDYIPKHHGVLRLLAYANHADMGSYREAIDAFLSGQDPIPNITAHERQGRVKYGFGANFEQELGHGLTFFGRTGWNEGRNESFAYTEVNDSFEAGAAFAGRSWRRPLDKAGLVMST
ncbi:MAG: carbohydrate porin, partial [Blastocatellia bacterium]